MNLSPPESFLAHNTAETLFNRLEAHGLTWKVYCDPPSHYSLTGLIHAPRLRDRFATHFFSTDQFFEDADKGDLPTYAFIEPQIIGHAHNDMHPPSSMLTPGLDLGPAVLADRRRGPARPALQRDPVVVVAEWLELPEHDVARHLRRTRRHLRPRPPAPVAPPDPAAPAGHSASPSTAPACGSRRWRSRHGSPNAPSSPTSTGHLPDLDPARALDPRRAVHRRDATAPSFSPSSPSTSPRAADWPDIVARPGGTDARVADAAGRPPERVGQSPLRRRSWHSVRGWEHRAELPPDAVITGEKPSPCARTCSATSSPPCAPEPAIGCPLIVGLGVDGGLRAVGPPAQLEVVAVT